MTAKRWDFAPALLLVRLQEVKLAETKTQGHAMLCPCVYFHLPAPGNV